MKPLAFTWPSPGSCFHLESEPVDRSVCLSASLEGRVTWRELSDLNHSPNGRNGQQWARPSQASGILAGCPMKFQGPKHLGDPFLS